MQLNPRCVQAGTIDDFLHNWSVVQQIQAINQQMAVRDANSGKTKPCEHTDVSEKENTHSQQHKSTQPAAAAHSEPHHDIQDAVQHLQLTDEHPHVQFENQEPLDPPFQVPVESESTPKPVLEDEPEEEVWQVMSSCVAIHPFYLVLASVAPLLRSWQSGEACCMCEARIRSPECNSFSTLLANSRSISCRE